MTPVALTDLNVAPSVLAADFARVGEQVDATLAAGARVIHLDVMDGHFVPTLAMGPQMVSALRDRNALLDVHLMVERPERFVADFASAGAHNITVHVEATPHVDYAVQAIKDAGCTAGVALCPGTPVEALASIAPEVDLVLCMTVNPGWGGQKFIPRSLGRIERLRALVGDQVAVEVDGGIDAGTAGPCRAAGASLFVAGSAVFGADDPAEAFRAITAAL